MLTPYSTQQLPEPTRATAVYPGFTLSDPSTTLFLSSVRDHPIRLSSALAPGIVASYPLVNLTTEAWIAPHSLLFSPDGKRFITGSDCLISVFDASRTGEGPVTRTRTIPSRHKQLVGGGVGMRGIVSALSETSTSNTLAAGTFTRHVSLYGLGEWLAPVGVFSVAGTDAEAHIGGSGITQLHWSPCGRYLYVVERKSRGVLIYDIRKTGQLLGWLEGRTAETNQRLGVDIVATGEESHEIWAGGIDGLVKVWSNPYRSEGAQGTSLEWAAQQDAVTSAIVHPTGSVVATCSGQRRDGIAADATISESSDDEAEASRVIEQSSVRTIDNSLKIWAL